MKTGGLLVTVEFPSKNKFLVKVIRKSQGMISSSHKLDTETPQVTWMGDCQGIMSLNRPKSFQSDVASIRITPIYSDGKFIVKYIFRIKMDILLMSPMDSVHSLDCNRLLDYLLRVLKREEKEKTITVLAGQISSQWGSIRCKQIARWLYLSRIKNAPHCSSKYFF